MEGAEIFAESERLILRRAQPEDLEPLVFSWSDPEMSRWTPDREDKRGFLTQMIADMQVKRPGDSGPGGPWYQFIVERRDDGALIGDLGVGFEVPGERQVEIGYRILPAFHRQGYAKEAAGVLIDYLIAAHRIHRFVGLVATPNEASKAVLRSLGFRQEGHFRESFWCNGEWIDDDYFALLASEWITR
ncbi:MAG TPA: GNAT family N-acetyltransferase [Allosphingosinicella sp.]|nr:GNAT family N-acetyltransferase [Allosphingosinicella sp.]